MEEIAHGEAGSIVGGDFNKANLRKVLPNYHQDINFLTPGDQTIDHCYLHLWNSYKTLPHPAFGTADHISILLPEMQARKEGEGQIPLLPPQLLSSLPFLPPLPALPAFPPTPLKKSTFIPINPIPSFLLQEMLCAILRFLNTQINTSLDSGLFQDCQNQATPQKTHP